MAQSTCKIWKPLSQKFTEIPQGSIVRASGRAPALLRDQMQLEISGMTILDEESAAGIPSLDHAPQAPMILMKCLRSFVPCARENLFTGPGQGACRQGAERCGIPRVFPRLAGSQG